jgi:hypothetical protein
MSLSFHSKTVIWLSLSSGLLGVGIYAALTGQQALAFSDAQGLALEKTRKELVQGRERAETYRTLIDRVGWRPGQALRHETINTSATIAGHESDRLNDILQANHVGKGQFFLRSLSIETVRGPAATEPSLKVTVKGDNILVLDRP